MTDDAQKHIEELREAAKPCFQCGICSSSCPVFRVAPGINPRLAVDAVVSTGELAEEGNEWLCAYCLMCDQRCPMGVSLADILIELKNLSAAEGNAPISIVKAVESFFTIGAIAPGTTGVDRKRNKLGLPEIPKPDPRLIKTLFERTGAMEILEKNLAKESSAE
ncbi:MAG: 4Fe-4S dicluster domain-containing protein [Candidatus Thorarchaeota archaeon]|jgi:heterodisulfide reductase subunit C